MHATNALLCSIALPMLCIRRLTCRWLVCGGAVCLLQSGQAQVDALCAALKRGEWQALREQAQAVSKLAQQRRELLVVKGPQGAPPGGKGGGAVHVAPHRLIILRTIGAWPPLVL